MIRKDDRFREKISSRRKLSALIAAGAIAIGGGGYGIVSATASSGSATATASSPSTGSVTATTASSTSAISSQAAPHGGGSNARSGPAAGGSSGTVDSVSKSSFTVVTGAGQKVTVKKASSTKYDKGTSSISASAIAKGDSVLVLGTTSGTTITASNVVVQSADGTTPSAAEVVPFKPGAPSTSKQAGQIPANYKQGSTRASRCSAPIRRAVHFRSTYLSKYRA
jgi:Domain of unknown function (DUF5666)